MLIPNRDSWGKTELYLTLVTLLISPLSEAFLDPHRGNVINVKSSLSNKVLLAREMLILLRMLNHIWDSWGNPEMDLT